ncbi:hypothetical protein AGMMS49975_29340 [Clostridia bacterium]|nr:hypothetical protein AGMMS49975_29340 [Clostridia bacterium]
MFYLIEYPVYMLDKIKLTKGGKQFESTLKESDLVINIAAGEVRRRNALSAELGKKIETESTKSTASGTSPPSATRLTDYVPPKTEAHPADTWQNVTPVNNLNTYIYKLTEKHVQAEEGKSLVPAAKMTDRLSFVFDGGSSTVTSLDEFPWADEGVSNNDKGGNTPANSARNHPEILSARIVLTDYTELLVIVEAI